MGNETTIEDLRAMVQALRDKEDIKEVIATYARALDGRDWELLKSCFTHDATIEGSVDTLSADQALSRSQRLAVQYVKTMHHLANQTVRIDGDSAEARTYVFAGHWKGDPPGTPHPEDLFGGVEYVDTLIRREGRWSIHHRRVLPIWRTGPRPAEMVRAAVS